MTYREKLISFHIVEKNCDKNFLIWTYPTLSANQKTYILENCFANIPSDYICKRNQNIWFYVREVVCDEATFAIVILSGEFEPNKYRLLSDILAKKYSKTKNPVELVSLYLDLYTSGCCSLQENGTTDFCNFETFESTTNLKELITAFDSEIILIYTAILLKRRVILYDSNVEQLLKELSAVCKLVPYRKPDDFLLPLIRSSSKLKGLSFFVAGTTDDSLIKDDRLYDVFVNMHTMEITISQKAEDVMVMTKTHKEIATLLVKLAASDLSEKQVIQRIDQRTRDLIDTLKNLVSTKNMNVLTVTDLKSKKLHPNLENFLFNLAVAENMMML